MPGDRNQELGTTQRIKADPPGSAVISMAASSADMTPYHSVVIVGAGVAGLNAARQLLPAFPDLLVLEAADRIGGRIKQVCKARWLHSSIIFHLKRSILVTLHFRGTRKGHRQVISGKQPAA